MEDKNNNNIDKFSFKDFLRVLKRRKWYFIASFLIVIIAGCVFTFINKPEYRTTSIIKPLENYFNNKVYEYFPEDAQKLWILPANINADDFNISKYREISEEIRSENILNPVREKISPDVSIDEIKNMVSVFIDRENKFLKVYTINKDADISFELNEAIINNYAEYKNLASAEDLGKLLLKIDREINLLKQDQADDSSGAGDSESFILNSLEEMKYNLTSNSTFFNERIIIYEKPVKPAEPFNVDYFKNIIITIVSAIVFGLIVTYLPGMFTPFKKQ